MSFCSFADEAAMFEFTPVENMFLIEQLPDAPAAELKVYLYARMLAMYPSLGGDMAGMAKALRMDEDAVYDAFTYWEHRGLLRRTKDRPPTYEFISMRGQLSDRDTAMDRKMYTDRDFNNSLRALFGEKVIGEHELRKAADWRNILRLEPEAVLKLVEYGINTSRSRDPKPPSVFRRMDRLAEEWSARGLHTAEEIGRAIAEEADVAPVARDVLKKLGIPRQPTLPELDSVRRWTGEWGYDRDQILSACEETVKARNPSIGYLDAILKNRLEEDADARRGLVEALRELTPGSAQPSPDQLAQYRALLDEGYSPEMIRLAAVQCRRVNKYHFDDLKWRLSVWRKDGVSTPEEADAYMKQMGQYSRRMRELFEKAGYADRRPAYSDLEFYRSWKDAWPEEVIGYAAECARGAGGSAAYMDKLLKAWRDAGVSTLEQAKAQRAAWQANNAARAGEKRPANPALDYQQREYRDEDFGDDFFIDLDKYAEEGDA